MAQIARNNTDKAADTAKDTTDNVTRIAKEGADRAADTTREVAEKTREVTGRVAERTAAAAEDVSQRSAQALRRSTEIGSRAMSRLFQADGDFARAWMDLASEQVTHNIETMRKLAASRDWREALEIQNDYVRETLSRMNGGFARHLDLVSGMMSRVLDTVEQESRKAA
jgi:gas vesicle protein